MCKISIIIPCFNSSTTIKRTINSVLSQTINDYEILIIDDCSNDWMKTFEIISSFESPKIKIFKHFVNKNGAVARNTGIKNAKGEYITFLDSDDEWIKDHLANSIKKINSEKYDLVYSRCLVKTSNFPDLIIPKNKFYDNENIGEYLFRNDGFIQTSSIFAKSKPVREIQFNPNLIRHQDYDFLLRLEDAGGKITMSNHIGVIVHWENSDADEKGGTWQYSLNWVLEYKQYLTEQAFSCFIFKNIIIRLLQKNQKAEALKILYKYYKFKYLSKKDLYFFISYFCFTKLWIPKWLKK
ncbi:MAG: glycosyltransferase family 2 protein [bacterium]|nr:glycosyltransferase family 2 protein [bacterium]